MAGSRKSSRSKTTGTDLVAHVGERLKHVVAPGDRLLLGFSGGIDSTVLLHVLARLRRTLGFELSALHVNHQISPNAKRWAAFCRATCRDLGVPCRAVRVTVARGNSIEGAARDARYAALRRVRADYIVLAHNLDDQAETVLLQLFRGAGVRGLAGMPLVRRETPPVGTRAGGEAALLRPLIAVSRAQIERYAAAHALEWVEDESNDDTRYTRNWLRRDVLPQLALRLPGVRATLSRAAANMAEAAHLLDDLACMDAGAAAGAGVIPLDLIRSLSPQRAKNLLRFFIAQRGWPMPTAERLQEGLRQALEARRDATIAVDLGACELRRHAAALHLLPRSTAPVRMDAVNWQGEDALAVPGWGTLTMRRTRGQGLSLARLRDAPVTIRARAGGERLQPASGRPRRTVKNLLQEAGLAPWERARLPCIYCGDRLVCVPGVAMDYRFQARSDEPAVVPSWRAG